MAQRAPFPQMICTWQKKLTKAWRLSWSFLKAFLHLTHKTKVSVMPESLPLLTQKKELETFSMLIHWFKISNHGIVILQWGSVLGSCILTMFAWILLWGTSCKGHKAWTNSLLTEIQRQKKKQTAGTEKAERVTQLMTVQFYGVIFNMAGFAVFTWRFKAAPIWWQRRNLKRHFCDIFPSLASGLREVVVQTWSFGG